MAVRDCARRLAPDRVQIVRTPRPRVAARPVSILRPFRCLGPATAKGPASRAPSPAELAKCAPVAVVSAIPAGQAADGPATPAMTALMTPITVALPLAASTARRPERRARAAVVIVRAPRRRTVATASVGSARHAASLRTATRGTLARTTAALRHVRLSAQESAAAQVTAAQARVTADVRPGSSATAANVVVDSRPQGTNL